MHVLIPNPLRSYTNGAGTVDAHGRTLDELTADLDRRFAGMRFRIIDEQRQIRPHIRFFVNGQPTRALGAPLSDSDEVMIVCALSGG
jgi:hypothetical protein